MLYCGIDLAAEPGHTGLATLDDADGSVVVASAERGVTDEAILEAVRSSDKTGVDVPVGWPQRFVEFVYAHAAQTLQPPLATNAAWRRELALRTTDREIQQRTGLTPLSVSANLIAYPAFRWAGIEARLRSRNIDTSRDGSGAVAEVYPAAALYRWGLPHRRYKGTTNREARRQIIQALPTVFPTFAWQGFDGLALADDNVLDAIIAALVAQQIANGHCEGPDDHHLDVARVEGWIWIPKSQPSTTV